MKKYSNKIKSLFSKVIKTIRGKQMLLLIALIISVIFSIELHAQNVNVDNSKINVGNGAFLNIDGNITIQNSGSVVNNGTIKLSRNWNNDALGLTGGGTGKVELNGISAQNMQGANTTNFYDLDAHNTTIVSLQKETSVDHQLTLNCQLQLNSNNLILGVNSPAVAGTLGSTNGLVVCNGTGMMRKMFTSAGSFLFPVGDILGITEYSPLTLNFTSGTFGSNGYAEATVINIKHPDNASAVNYLQRYWNVNSSNISVFNCNISGSYPVADIAGTETSISSAQLHGIFNQQNNPWVKYQGFTGTHSLVANNVTQFSSFTGITLTPASVSISGPNNKCVNEGAVTLHTNAIGDGPFTFLWSNNETSQSIQVNPGSNASYSVTVTDANGISSSSSPFLLTVNSLPAVGATASPNDSICQGNFITLKGTGASSYVWQQNCVNATDGVPFQPCAIGNGTPVTSETYNVIGTDVNGCSNTSSIVISTVRPPVFLISSNTGSLIFCNQSSIILDAGTGNLTQGYITSYLWSTNATSQTISVNTASTYTVTCSNFFGCTSTDQVTTIVNNSVPAKPGIIAGQITGMCGQTGTFSIPPVPTALSYLWSVTNGGITTITNTQGTTSVDITFGTFSNATVSVRATNECGQSIARTLTVKSKPDVPGPISGMQNGVCKTNGLVYSISPVDGASSYNWKVPAGVTIVGPNNGSSITINFTTAFHSPGSICVRASNGCGKSSFSCYTVIAVPMTPVTILQNGIPTVNGNASVCLNAQGVVYSTPSLIGATSYIWSVPQNATIVGPNNGPSIIVNFSNNAGKIKVCAINSCGKSFDYTLNIHFTCRESSDAEHIIITGEINVYPNPVHENLSVNISSELNQKCSIRLIDVIGKQMMVDVVELTEGDNLYQYDVSGYGQGLYFIVINREGLLTETIRVVVE